MQEEQRGGALMRGLAVALGDYRTAGMPCGDSEAGFLRWIGERSPETARRYETALKVKRAAMMR